MADIDALKGLGYTSHKLPVAVLPILQQTVLKKAHITLHAWPIVFGHILSGLESSLPTAVQVKTLVDQSKDRAEATTLMLLVNNTTTDAKEHAANIKALDKRLASLKTYCGRYCVVLSVETREKLDGRLYRVRFTCNRELNNAAFYGVALEEQTRAELNLSPSFRLVLTTETLNSKPFIRIRAEDLVHTVWTSVLDRVFPADSASASEVSALISLLTTAR